MLMVYFIDHTVQFISLRVSGHSTHSSCETAHLLQEINSSTTELPLTISYDTIALGKLRFWIHMQDAVYSLQQFGELNVFF